jgi:hypothetical protein
MKQRSNRRVTAYVQGRHRKKPVHICVSEKEERERENACAISVGDEREDQYKDERKKRAKE